MQIQRINRTDAEKVYLVVHNVEATSITTGMGVALAAGNEDVVASADGISAVRFTASAELRPSFVGVAKADIAANEYGLVQSFGYAASISLSPKTYKTIVLLAGASLLGIGGGAGTFMSTIAPEAISTYCGKYVVNMVTTNISSARPYTSGLIRCL